VKVLAVLICIVTGCLAQTTQSEGREFKALGSARLEATADRIAVYFMGREYRVDLSRLPLSAKDCPEQETNQKCATHPGTRCLDCITEWSPIAWDEPRRLFYMAASTNIGKNRPWVIFAYDLRSSLIKRIGTNEGGGFGSGAVSASGRYLAYIGYNVCGVCCTTSQVVLIDVQSGVSGQYQPLTADEDERPRILALRWVGPSTIEVEAQILRESACRAGQDPGKSSTASVKVNEILRNR
jgi:hypothetical protein